MTLDDKKILEDYELFSSDSNYQRWLLAYIENKVGNRILDVGTGIGGWIKHFKCRDIYISMDISEYRLNIAKKAYREDNIIFLNTDICSDEACEISHNNIDTILCVNTIEHIEDDIRALENMFNILVKEGRLILITPALKYIYGSLDRKYGHFRRYSMGDISQKIINSGFQIEQLYYINLLGAIGWFVYGKILKIDSPPKRSFSLFNKLVGLYASFDRFIGPPGGLSMIAICKK